MTTVSFLMSNYKTTPAYLRLALDSMLAQTMADFEAVIVNDGVRDESYDVLREYAAVFVSMVSVTILSMSVRL